MKLAPRVTHISRRGRAGRRWLRGVAEHLIYIFFNLYIERAEERLKREMKDGGGRWEVGGGGVGVQAGGERGAGDK